MVYTFRTFPYQKELESVFGEVVVLGKLKKDLQAVYKLIIKEKPQVVLGVALSPKGGCWFESRAMNRFNN
ncbi:MAG: hypothetical protein GXP43_00885, partial [bacterium]|nr:hypothetical protein [bacterium]